MFQILQNCSSQTKQLSITVFTQRTIEQTVRPPRQINNGGDKGREADGPVRASTGAPVLHDLWLWLQTLQPEPGKQEVQEKHGWSKQGLQRNQSGANGVRSPTLHLSVKCLLCLETISQQEMYQKTNCNEQISTEMHVNTFQRSLDVCEISPEL